MHRDNRVMGIVISVVGGILLIILITSFVQYQVVLSSPSMLYVESTGNCGGVNPCFSSIQEAINSANEGDTIKVSQGVYTGSGFFVIYIDKGITIAGGYTRTNWINSFPITQTTIIDAERFPRRRAIYIETTSVSTATLSGVTIQNGLAENANGGGLFVSNGNLEILDSKIFSNSTSAGDAFGGGVFIQGGNLVLERNFFRANNSTSSFPKGQGGALYISDTIATIVNNVFEGNSSYYYGGAIRMLRSSSKVIGNSFIGNSSTYGGGIHAVFGSAILGNNTFIENNADHGGGIYQDSVISTIRGNSFMSNSAQSAASISLSGGNVSILENTFISNSAEVAGGVVRMSSIVTAANNTIISNSAGTYGGAIFVDGGSITLNDNEFGMNIAEHLGGGALYVQGGVLTIQNNHFYSNTSKDGGAVYIEGGRMGFENNLFEANVAEQNGGALFTYGDGISVSLKRNVLLRNSAENYGSGMAILGGNVRAQNDIVANNVNALEAVYIGEGYFYSTHWTLVNNGSYALTSNGASAYLTNTLVSDHDLGGLFGQNIFANSTLFHTTVIPCGSGAQCINNHFGDPSFVDPTGGDYHITASSNAIDRGIVSGVYQDFDLEPRIGIPDIGADEYWEPGYPKNLYLPIIQNLYQSDY